ncbi:MAG: DUF898 domain-containing protein [bacterium]|nr:DUF898 domain-containing protein [bacterium]
MMWIYIVWYILLIVLGIYTYKEITTSRYKAVKVTVTPRVPLEELHAEDKDVPGEYVYLLHKRIKREQVLDIFHFNVPIKVLEDFFIYIE